MMSNEQQQVVHGLRLCGTEFAELPRVKSYFRAKEVNALTIRGTGFVPVERNHLLNFVRTVAHEVASPYGMQCVDWQWRIQAFGHSDGSTTIDVHWREADGSIEQIARRHYPRPGVAAQFAASTNIEE